MQGERLSSLSSVFDEIAECFRERAKSPSESWEEFLAREPRFRSVYDAICKCAEKEGQ